ncbi:hypothetical protein [Shewanella sp. T24-MNA-CIBAN-0130]|uniref:hypothetical protein n=1 Tax=Shewanella sp. T24-MNA-CIBAN-0130 TaxID=3140470 RepID=UPI003331D4CC
MQQIKPVQQNKLDTVLPAPTKSTNKSVYPVTSTQSKTASNLTSDNSQLGLLSRVTNDKDGTQPIYSGTPVTYTDNPDQPGFGFNGTPTTGTPVGGGNTKPINTGTPVVNQQTTGNSDGGLISKMPPKPGTPYTGGNENSATTPPKTPNGSNQPPQQPPQQPGTGPTNQQYMVPSQQAQSIDFQGNDFVSNGYNGVQGDQQYAYNPKDPSLVQNQITGLLDPNSDIMRKAQAQAQAYSAQRGLQSSSIGNEVALSSMIDKALPIAQQDAQTYNQAQTLGWNQNFTNDQENLKREHDAGMADKQGDINNQVQNNQMEWQSQEKGLDRNFQTQLEDLKYRQQLGTLDKQQELQLVQMEKSASIQTQRDEILNTYQVELNELQNDQRWKELNAQIDSQVSLRQMELSHDMRVQYGNSIGDATNAALQAVGMAMTNPNMTKEQQSAAVQEIMNSLSMQTNMLGILYGAIPAPAPGTSTGTNTGPATGISNPNQPQIPYPTTTPGAAVGANGGTTAPSVTDGTGTAGGGGGGGYKPAQKQR